MFNIRGNRPFYGDKWMMQVAHIDDFIKFIYKKYTDWNIIEIGTAYGSLTNLLCDYYGQIKTYDREVFHTLHSEGAKKSFKQADCHDDDFLEQEFKSNLDSEKGTVFFIDGGNKALEFNKLRKYAKVGDILMVHDYSIDQQDFQTRGKAVFNSFEVQESDLDLEGFERASFFETALGCAWGAYVKI